VRRRGRAPSQFPSVIPRATYPQRYPQAVDRPVENLPHDDKRAWGASVVPTQNISTKVDPFRPMSVLYAYIRDVSHIYKDF